MKYIIFVERIWDDEIFSLLKQFIRKHKPENVHLYCLTPTNYYLTVAEQGYTGSKSELSRIMAERYKILKKIGCKIDLHLHLSMRPDKLSDETQEKMFKEAVGWMKSKGFVPREWMAGWYLYNQKSLDIGEELGMDYNKNIGKYHLHCYELNAPFKLMLIIQNLRGLLR